jgi:hypothetical protein
MSGDRYEGTNVGVMGKGATAGKVIFDQRAGNANSPIELQKLALELAFLRVEARKQAVEPEHDDAIASLGRAEMAAKSGAQSDVIKYLKEAGSWAGGVASKVGASIVAKLIEGQFGK